MGLAAMRGGTIAAVFLIGLALSGCGPAGVVANSMVKTTQGDMAGDLERDIKQRLAAEPTLSNVKISVAISNVWRDAFQTRYSVLLAGTVPSEAARTAAVATVRQVIGSSDDAVIIADKMRLDSR